MLEGAGREKGKVRGEKLEVRSVGLKSSLANLILNIGGDLDLLR